MRITFLMDSGQYIETTPDLLQLRQTEKGTAHIGVNISQKNAEGEEQILFHPLVGFPVDLKIAKPRKTKKAKSNG
jgi:hypothetical protein